PADLDGDVACLLADPDAQGQGAAGGVDLDDGAAEAGADGEEGLDAGHLQGGGGVQGLDLGPGAGAAEDGPVEEAGAVDGVAVLGLAGGLVGPVEALDLGADDTALLRPGSCHGVPSYSLSLPALQRASMAWRICS